MHYPIPTAVRAMILLSGLVLNFNSFAADRYLLCGPDEDGCPENGYQYCACIPYNEIAAAEAFCLDFDLFTCKPLSKSPDCDPNMIYKDQAHCLAVIYQSNDASPCSLTTGRFCKEHHSYICDEDGLPQSCHKLS